MSIPVVPIESHLVVGTSCGWDEVARRGPYSEGHIQNICIRMEAQVLFPLLMLQSYYVYPMSAEPSASKPPNVSTVLRRG